MRGAPSLDGRGTARAALEGGAFPSKLVAGLGRFDLGEETLLLARELASMATGLDDGGRRALTHLTVASLVGRSRGSTRLPLAGGDGSALRWIGEQLALEPAEREAVEALAASLAAGDTDACAPVVGSPSDHAPLMVAEGHLYHQKSWVLEGRVAAHLAARLGAPTTAGSAESAVADVCAQPPRVSGRPLALSREQRQAVTRALQSPLTVISGGPGTGKTSIVVSILRALARVGDPPLEAVALAAPTGKAADRMRQSVAIALRRLVEPAFADRELLREPPPALTLHRLLGYSPRSGRYRYHERNPIQARFVVVDESSMIDLQLMDRLLRALPEEARLVLLGDARQLPSVEAGAVFRDLCGVGGERMIELKRSYRMDASDPAGRRILLAAQRIDARRTDALLGTEDGIVPVPGPGDIAFEGVELAEVGGPRARHAVLERWAEAHRAALPDRDALVRRTWTAREGVVAPDARDELERLFTHQERFRVLCLTQGRATGVDAVNAWFADWTGSGAGRAGGLGPGTPLIVLRNDYDRGLFNGDQGLVLRTGSGPAAVFRRDAGFVAFPLESVRSIVGPAWAITVHKAQGSEHDHVMVVLPDVDIPLLTRELLYTAVTRSRRSVLLVGSRRLLLEGVGRAIDRHSGVAERLRATST
ncbi:MAG: ATP-dependent DNA helicase [Myxococcota bacterium]